MASTAPVPSTLSPSCPTCGSDLALEHDAGLDAWVCPRNHGMGFTLSEAYVRIEEDEIRTIWQQARVAAVGSRPCPICSTTMVKVAVAPRGNNDAALDLDVCVVDEFFWFEAGELDAIPVATADPVPSPEEEARIVEITKEFGNELSEGWGARDNTRLRDHLINRYGNRAANT